MYINDKPETTSTSTTTTHQLEPDIVELNERVGKVEFNVNELKTNVQTARQETLVNSIAVETATEGVFTANEAVDALAKARDEDKKAMDATLAAMQSALDETKSDLAAAQQQITDIKAAADSSAAVVAALKALSAALPSGNVLSSPGSSCNSGSCAPTVESEGDDVLFTARKGTVRVDTQDCGKVDVCALAKAVDAIKLGLEQL